MSLVAWWPWPGCCGVGVVAAAWLLRHGGPGRGRGVVAAAWLWWVWLPRCGARGGCSRGMGAVAAVWATMVTGNDDDGQQ